MLRCNINAEDMQKLLKAHGYLSRLIELIEEYNRKNGTSGKPSGFVIEAHRLLSEVLYDE